MDELRRRIHEDLAGVFDGEVLIDALSCAHSASDGSLHRVTPLGICFPKHHDDVVALAKYSEENEISLVPRGAGTGLAGGAIGPGLIVDFSRHMNAIERVDSETVRVQPGIVRNDLNRKLKPYGRYFAPDPALADVTTIGGMIGVDSAGSHAIRVGSTRSHVQGLHLVLSGGLEFAAGREVLANHPPEQRPVTSDSDGDIEPDFTERVITGEDRKSEIVRRLRELLTTNRDLILERQPALVRNCCGYFLRGALTELHLDLPRLLVGSEGTLGMVTSATLNTTPLANNRGVALLLFGSLEHAINVVQKLIPLQPSACDLLDRRLLSLGREADPKFEAVIPATAESGLLIEQIGYSDDQVRDRIATMIRAARDVAPRLIVASEAHEPEDVEFLWSLPHKATPLLTRLEGKSRAQPFVEDIAVPPESVHEFLIRSQKVFQRHQVTASLYAHAASGQVHLRPFLPTPTQANGAQLEAIARDLYQAVFLLGGSISGEHGDGYSRTSFIRSQYGPLYRVFQEIKELFDPNHLMNPGKIISDDPHLTIRNLRPPLDPQQEIIPLQLQWRDESFAESIDRCNSCGQCKTSAPDMRMCPFHRADPHEETSPRSKVNVLRDHLAGLLSAEEITGPEMRRLSASCFNCKMCERECTSHVNVPGMVIEAKGAYVATNGLSGTDWLLSRAHSFGRLGTSFSFLSNWILSNPGARWLLEKFFGVARNRKLPTFARRSFLRTAASDLTRTPARVKSKRSVIYFLDHYANYHDPQLARCFVAILKHHGYQVYVPPEQISSGMAMISAGDLDSARDVAEQNIRLLADYAREGWPILCTEPAAAIALTQEYPQLIDHPDVDVVASQVREAGAFLAELQSREELRTDFNKIAIKVGYHTPCHLRALERGTPLRQLIEMIPGVEIEDIEKGCSGMAGAFGLSAEHFETSLKIGEELMTHMADADLTAGVTECSSCKIQMEQQSRTPTLHPLKLLAFAWGIADEVQSCFRPSRNPRVVT